MFRKFDSSTDVSTSTPVKSSVQRAIKAQILQQHPHFTEDIMDELIPKKSSLIQYKVTAHLMLYCQRIEYPPEENRVPSDVPILFQHRDGPILPTLKWIHPYIILPNHSHHSHSPPPSNTSETSTTITSSSSSSELSSSSSSSLWTHVTVDQGAIPYLLGGANIMCPGLTKVPGSYMPPDIVITTTNANEQEPSLHKGQGVIIFAEHQVYPIAVGVMTMDSMEMYVFIYAFVIVHLEIGSNASSTIAFVILCRNYLYVVVSICIYTDERKTKALVVKSCII
jgi:malignant T-cell-amplified sequence